jgi:hypothetical protein
MPLLAVLFTWAAYLISKKNKLFSNKKAIFYVLLIGLCLSIPGLLGFLDYEFMPYYYIFLVVVYLVVGWFTIGWIRHLMPNLKKDQDDKLKPYILEFLIHFVIMIIGAAFFSMIFNLCNELQYGWWACTCVFPFVLPTLLHETYQKYMDIPLEINKIWHYDTNVDLTGFEYMDYNKLTVMELELFRQAGDSNPIIVKAKAPDNSAFGVWFQKFIMDYNVKSPANPIELRYNEKNEESGWIFYVKRSFFMPRKYVDYELTIPENKIREKHTIVAKRVTLADVDNNKLKDEKSAK